MPNPHFLCASPYIFLWQLHMTHLPEVPPRAASDSPVGRTFARRPSPGRSCGHLVTAIVGGPVGAVVGGAIGATSGAAAGAGAEAVDEKSKHDEVVAEHEARRP
jgi:uncharacterized membrane protein